MKNKMIGLSWVVALITWLVAFMYEPSLPEQVPTHWNAKGEVDGFTTKPWGVYLIPLMSTVLILILAVLPRVSPKGYKLDQAKHIYDLIIFIMSLFMLGIMVLSFETALNKDIEVGRWVMCSVGVLFILLGNYLTKVPKNFFLGIRTPWTLASDKVWFATHRVGAWCFVIAGVVVIIGVLLSLPALAQVSALVFAGLFPVFYSLYAYYRIEGFKKSEN